MSNVNPVEVKRILQDIRSVRSLNQAEFGQKIGYSRQTVANWEGGKARLTIEHIEIIRTKCGLQSEKIRRLMIACGYNPDDYDQATKKSGLDELPYYLEEWKLVHNTVQELYIASKDLVRYTYWFEANSSEDIKREIERLWHSNCEDCAYTVGETIAGLKYIRSHFFDEYLAYWKSKKYVPYDILALQRGVGDGGKVLRDNITKFNKLLEDILRVVDAAILKIAADLKG